MKPEIDLESEMLDALELFQYAHSYRNQILVFVLENEVGLAKIVQDLKVISRADIVPVIITCGSSYTEQLVQTLAERGLPLQYLSRPPADAASRSPVSQIRELLQKRTIPVLGFETPAETSADSISINNIDLWQVGIHYAHELGASRVFILSAHPGLTKANSLVALLSHGQLQQLMGGANALNIENEFLELIQNSAEADEFDIVLLAGTSGNVFQEIFTHLGSGTLFTDEHPNQIRRARLRDVFDISNLTKPWVKTGTLLPITDDDIAREIDSFFVFTVNEAVVAAARLSGYGDTAQIARVSTLPRYRRRGYARELLSSMIEVAKSEGKRMVFGLSVEPLMWQLFRDLGFQETPREQLPEDWKKSYDFSRPSKAFTLELG